MARKQPEKSRLDTSLPALAALLANGYTEELRSLTRGIQSDPRAVIAFGLNFDRLHSDQLFEWESPLALAAPMSRVESSLDELADFFGGGDSPFDFYLTVVNHGPDMTTEIGWKDSMEGKIVWDRWTAAVDDPVMLFAEIGYLFDIKDYRCEAKPGEKPAPPLYRYHPERFKAERDYAEALGKFYRHNVLPESGSLTLDQLNDIGRLVVGELNLRSMKFPRKVKDSHPHPSLVNEAEHVLATAYGRFVQAGRQIMDFPPALMEMLAKTDVDDIALASIRMPYAAQYLYFGAQADLELEPGWLVDGAYVEFRGEAGDVRFVVTAVPTDPLLSRQWYLFPEAQYEQDFVGQFRSMDLATAIDTVLSEKLASLRDTATADVNLDAMLKHGMELEGRTVPENLTIVNVSADLAVERLGMSARRHPVYRAALQLVVNALCYVAAYPDDIDTVWPQGTPEALQQKILHGKGKEPMRARSKLAALGYVPVHICGKRIAEQRSAHGLDANAAAHVAIHWRRGHWRNQVHGPARSLRRLIWVMPVVVGANQRDEPDTGHVYLVS